MKQTKKAAKVRYEYAFSVKCMIVAIVLLSLVMTYRTVKNAQDIKAAKIETQRVRLAVAKKQAENKSLQEQIEHLQSEEYIVKLARSKYFYSFDDEIVFQLPNEQAENK